MKTYTGEGNENLHRRGECKLTPERGMKTYIGEGNENLHWRG